jgi:DNA-binding transcriptional LysR family regulator
VFRLGPLRDSSLVARKLLTYRHQLVASPAYIERVKSPEKPQDLIWCATVIEENKAGGKIVVLT